MQWRFASGLSGRGTRVAVALLALALAALPAGASTTLGELAAGVELLVNGVTYSEFEVSVKGKGLSQNLDDYRVETEAGGGFTVELATGEKPGKNGKITLDYQATGSELVAALLGVSGLEDAKVKASQKLFDVKKVGKLSAKNKQGKDMDATDLPSLSRLTVETKIKAKGGGTVTVSAVPVPEPGTALLVAGGLLGLSVSRRRWAAQRTPPKRSGKRPSPGGPG